MNIRAQFAICIVVSIMMSGVTADANDPVPRKWTDATGVFSVEAEFVGVENGNVRLKRADGKILDVKLQQLCSADQEFVRRQTEQSAQSPASGPETVSVAQLAKKPQELKNDDGKPAGKKSFPMGIAAGFKATHGATYLTSIRIHGSRYGYPKPPKEDFHVSLCDKDFKLVADFPFPYSKFPYGTPEWVTLRMKPTRVPSDFVICLDFKAEQRKGVYVSHDTEGRSLVGLAGKKAGAFSGGDWLIRPIVDSLKAAE